MKLVYFFFVICSLLVEIFLKPERSSSFNSTINFVLSLTALVNVLLFWRYIVKKSSWINFEILFTFGFLIVNFQIPFLASIGIEPDKPELIWTNKWVVNYATWLSLIAIQLWILGYLLLDSGIYVRKINTIKKRYICTKRLDVFLVITFTGFLLLVGNTFISGSYNSDKNWGTGASYVYLFLRVSICLRIYYFFYLKNKLNIDSVIKNKVFFFILILYCLIFLNAGDRTFLIEIITVSVISYNIFIKQVTFRIFLFGIILTAFLFNIIKSGRTSDAANRKENIISTGYKAFSQEENINPTDELASSNRILYLALDYVPDKHPYLYGITFSHDIISTIPFAMYIYMKFSRVPEFYSSTSYFFTILRQGNHYSSGDGSQILADIYVNFGVYGLFLIMFAFGCLISFVQLEALEAKRSSYLIIYVFLVVFSIYINRSNLLNPLKTIIYALLIDYFLIKKESYEK